jgi:hypothetical protein
MVKHYISDLISFIIFFGAVYYCCNQKYMTCICLLLMCIVIEIGLINYIQRTS